MPSDLERFVAAQEGVYEGALRELRQGRKTGHWIWFIFPQFAGLGRSEMSRFYGIESVEETRAYLDHPVLGPRLRECVVAVLTTSGRTAEGIFGSLDAMKVRSSMTLFLRAAPEEPLFGQVLERFYEGVEDETTAALLLEPDLQPAPAWWDETATGEPMPNWKPSSGRSARSTEMDSVVSRCERGPSDREQQRWIRRRRRHRLRCAERLDLCRACCSMQQRC